jgi:putative copper resistance protein D
VHLFIPLSDQLPPLRGSAFASTGIAAVPVVLEAVALVLYLWGVVRNNRLYPRHRWSVGRTVAWVAALVVTMIAVGSFVGVYDGELFWDHMVQHLLLIMVAAALFAIASPLALAHRATTGTAHRWVNRALRSAPARFLGHPLVAFITYALVIPVTHLTSFFNWTLAHETVHDTEHFVFLICGYLFWRQVFGIDPNEHRLSPPLQLVYLFLAVPIDTFTGLSLMQARHELFPAYTQLHRNWGPALLSDLHIGGAIMWVGGDTLMLLAMIPVCIKWLQREERHQVVVDRELDRIMATPDAVPVGDQAAPRPAGRSGWRAFLPPSGTDATRDRPTTD